MGLRKRLKALGRAIGNGMHASVSTDARNVTELIGLLRPWRIDRNLIRVGPERDGGYLLPDDLAGIAACVSPGVSVQSGFDYAIAERGIDVYMADASVDGPALTHPRFHFEKRFFGPVTNAGNTTIEDFCAGIPGFAAGGDLLLQMDIEGAEYHVVQNMSATLLKRFRNHDCRVSRPGKSVSRLQLRISPSQFRKTPGKP